MYSIVKDGQVLDYKFQRLSSDAIKFSVGDICVGLIWNMRNGWSIVGNKGHRDIYPLHGFRTRIDAAQALLKLEKVIDIIEES